MPAQQPTTKVAAQSLPTEQEPIGDQDDDLPF